MKNWGKYTIILSAFFCLLSSTIRSQEANADTLVKASDSLTLLTPQNSTPNDTLPIKNSKQVDQIISYAKKFLGTPYRYAGSTPSGFDCSGFIYYVMGNFGLELTRSSYGLAEFGKTVKLIDLRPGDLMFFKGSSTKGSRVGHVALVVEVSPDAIKFIHSSTSRGVIIDNFKTSKYFIPRYITSKRLDYGISDK